MSDQPYTFEYDQARAVMKVRLAGNWTMATLDRYRTELSWIIGEAGPHGLVSRLLVDLRARVVQPRDVAAGMQKAIADAHRGRRVPLRVAIVQPASMLTHLQARRVTEHDGGSSLAASEEEALAWLAQA